MPVLANKFFKEAEVVYLGLLSEPLIDNLLFNQGLTFSNELMIFCFTIAIS